MASIQTNNQVGDQNPIDIILIWTGFLANIPLGWFLCDGNNGTPDFTERFLKEVPTAGTNPGGIGGVATVGLTTSNMSNHFHSGTGTSHVHVAKCADDDDDTDFSILGGDDAASGSPTTNSVKIVNTVQTQGGNAAHNNLPQFFEVAYIQRKA